VLCTRTLLGSKPNLGIELLLAQAAFRREHDRRGRADRQPSGQARDAARGAARLAVPVGEDGAFFGEAIYVRRRMGEARAAARIAAEIVPAGVVGRLGFGRGMKPAGRPFDPVASSASPTAGRQRRLCTSTTGLRARMASIA
jgi:hypothetical protein